MPNLPRSGIGPTIAHSVMPSAPAKRPAPPESAAAPRAKRAYKTPYTVFCQEQRPHLPTSFHNPQREKTLGQMWVKLSAAEKAKYTPVLVPAPAHAPTTPWCGYNSSLALPKRRAPPPTAVATAPMLACRAPMPTAVMAIPMPTAAVAISAPDLTRTAAPAPLAAPSLTAAVATPPEPLAPPALTTGILRLPEPQREATPPWIGPPTLTAPPIPTVPPTPSASTGLQRLTAVAMVALKRMAPQRDVHPPLPATPTPPPTRAAPFAASTAKLAAPPPLPSDLATNSVPPASPVVAVATPARMPAGFVRFAALAPAAPPAALRAAPPAAPLAAPLPLPADLAQMFDEPIGLDGALRAAPPTPSAAPIVSSSSWLEQQELAEVLEEQLTGLDALEAIEVSKRQYE